MSHSEQQQFEDWLADLSKPRRDVFSMLLGNRRDHEDAAILETLDALALPMSLPGETLYRIQRGDEISVYDPNGFPLTGDVLAREQAMMAFVGEEIHFATSLWQGSIPIWVSTSYTGSDQGISFRKESWVPEVWETMILTDGSWSSWQMRYHTKAAAQTAHSLIVGCLLSIGLTLAEADH